MKRRIEITVETQRVTLFNRRSVSATAWCAACGARVLLVTAQEAARIAGLTAREIFRRVEAAALHFAETPDGELLVCRESLRPDAAPHKLQPPTEGGTSDEKF